MHVVKRPSDFLSGLVFFLVGAFALSVARTYSLGTLRTMGPGYFPILVSGLLCFLGVTLVAKSFAGDREERIAIGFWPLIVVSGGIVVFGLLILKAGLLLAIIALVLIVCAASGRYRPVSSTLLALGLAVACVGIFVLGLGQQLPIFGEWFSFLSR